MKPQALHAVVATQLALTAFDFVVLFSKWGQPDFQEDAVWSIAFTPFSLLVLWFLWKGKNWARIVTLIVSCIVVVGTPLLFLFDGESIANALEGASYIAWIMISLYLLWWLNTKEVKTWFKRPAPVVPYDGIPRPPIPEP